MADQETQAAQRGPNLTDVLLYLARIEDKQDRILRALHRVESKEGAIMADLTALTAQVQANTDTEQSAIVLLNQLSVLIQQNANDPAALNDLANKLKASSTDLAAAVVANTPAGPPAPPTPGGATKRKP